MVTLLASSLGAAIRRARRSLRITQEELGRRIGLSDSYVSQIETGQRTPSYETLQVICEYLGLDYREMAALAADLPATEPGVEDPELDLLFHQLKDANLPASDLRYVKETIRTALKIRRERGEMGQGS